MTDLCFRITDTETTGITVPEHAVVELATLDIVGDRLGEGRSSLVNPGRPIPPEASAIHHITDADVADAPALAEVIPSILTVGEPDIFVAHEADFERMFVGQYTDKPWICTMRCAMRVWPEAQAFNLGYLRYWLAFGDLGLLASPPHRGLPDCYVAGHVFMRLTFEATIEEMISWSAEPALYPRVPFGMHRGKTWPDLPRSYIEFILDKPNDLSDDIKWNARRERDRRAHELRQSYLKRALPRILSITTVADLNNWYHDELVERLEHGIGDATAEYADIVKACAARKATILSGQSSSETT